MLEIRPITLREANAYVAQHHRHNQPTNGHKWSLAVYDGDRLCGVAIAGQPIARRLDDGMTIEVRRVCTDGTHNACSALYGACARVAKEMGYARILTYTLVTEPGTSLKASGWKDMGEAGGGYMERTFKTARTDADNAFWRRTEISHLRQAQMGKTV